MGQKIHPTGLRLGITKSHLSRWFADVNRYGILAEEDHKIRKFIEKTLSNAGIAEILIDRKADQVDLEIRTARYRLSLVVVEQVSSSYVSDLLNISNKMDRLKRLALAKFGLMSLK